MKNFLYFPFLKDTFNQTNLILGLGLNLFLFSFLFFKAERSSSIALHYNIYYGIDLIGEWQRIFIIPLSGLIILIFNWLLAYFLYQREKLACYFILAWTSLIEILFLISGICLVLID